MKKNKIISGLAYVLAIIILGAIMLFLTNILVKLVEPVLPALLCWDKETIDFGILWVLLIIFYIEIMKRRRWEKS